MFLFAIDNLMNFTTVMVVIVNEGGFMCVFFGEFRRERSALSAPAAT